MKAQSRRRPISHAARMFSLESNERRNHILDLVEEFAQTAHAKEPFVPGKTHIPVSGKVYGAEEMRALADSCLDFWLTAGRYNTAFERHLADILDVKQVLTVNSGSSANLV